MTEEEILTQKAAILLQEFASLPLVKQYQKLKETITEDSHLVELKQRIDNLKQGVKYLSGEKKIEAINAIKSLTEEYDSDPLIINYRSYREEVLQLIEPLTEAKL